MGKIFWILALLFAVPAAAQVRNASLPSAGMLSGDERIALTQSRMLKQATLETIAKYMTQGLMNRDTARFCFATKKQLADSIIILRRKLDSVASRAMVAGPKGDSGARGPQGVPGVGVKGDKGDSGNAGAAGATGSTGAAGAAGSNGKDGTNGFAPLWSKSALISNTPIEVIDTFSITSATPTITLPLPAGKTAARVKSVVGYRPGATAANSPQVSISGMTATTVSLVLTQASSTTVTLLGITVLGLQTVPDPANVKVYIAYVAY